MNENKVNPNCEVDAQVLSEALLDSLKIQTKPGESTDVIDEKDLADVNVETDQEADLLEENGSNQDKPRPMCFGPTKKQKKPRRNRSNNNKAKTSEKESAPNLPKGDKGTSSSIDQSQNTSMVQAKRQRSNYSTPLNDGKRPKTNTGSLQVRNRQGTYAELASEDLRVLELDEVNGIKELQVGILEEKLMDIMDEFLETSPTRTPEYWTASFAFANVKFVCSDEFSVQWLMNAVVTMPPPWTGASLKAKRMSEVVKPRSRPIPRPQIKFFVSDGTIKKSFEEVIKHVQLRNSPIITKRWSAWKEEPVPNGTFYHVSVDESAIDVINGKNSRLFYYFTTIKIIIPKAKNLEGDIDKSDNDKKQM